MAKSARATRVKNNRSNLRARVFGPVEDARAERLSAKLTELAAQPLPDRPQKMDTDSSESKSQKKAKQGSKADAMDVDTMDEDITARRQKRKAVRPNRIHKKRRAKPSAQMTFPKGRRGQVQSNRRDKRQPLKGS